jgi:hypothetical protein
MHYWRVHEGKRKCKMQEDAMIGRSLEDDIGGYMKIIGRRLCCYTIYYCIRDAEYNG